MATKVKSTKSPAPAAASGPVAASPPPVIAAAKFPIVGIGASAGGLAAFDAFFSGMPADRDPGMAFVLVQHLAPDHSSILTALVQRNTRMHVREVEDGMVVEINCAYIIPPNRDMAFLNGTLHLLEPVQPRGHRLPIDYLFRSLAQDQRERAIGIVLSGTGSDGTLGVRAIKGEGGMVMVQNPASAEFDGMPRNTIATGLVDFELPPAEMPAQLIAYVTHAFGHPPNVGLANAFPSENALKKIFLLLRTHTGHDFSQYKPNTIYRRIERRMAVHQINTMDSYVKYLQHTAAEVDALFHDLLIGVTNFFRDPEAFALLEEHVIPKLFTNKPAGSVVRAWSVGCSTGEEAYSLAILLQEQLNLLKLSYKVQVFATDLDDRAIAVARIGLYPASIAADITPERLARFFTIEPDGSAYRVHKSIRDMLVFSEHNLIKNPPFSKLDLVSCRNLLIYMGAELQKKVMSLFHYALLPGGMLFLGSSETAGELADMFAVVDRKAKIYQRKEDFQGAQRAALGRFLPPLITREVTLPPVVDKIANTMKLSLRTLTEQTLLQHLEAAAVLVNGQGDILYLHGRTGMFLEPAPGEAGINNVVKMAREGLRRELTTVLHKATVSKEMVQALNLRVKTNGHFSLVNLAVRPVAMGTTSTLESPLYLVVLEVATVQDAQPHPLSPPMAISQDSQEQINDLNEELQAKEEYLHATNEELETSNEELKSSNEEMQSVNEELQSTNEELETSKEELQSINEELATVNTELQTKVTDLSRANNDMNNLLAGTGIGTIFVDHALRIMRFTPAATQIIHLILSDVGRPVGHIASNLLGYDRLVADVQAVLKNLQPIEADVETLEHRHYTMYIRPYRTLDNVIEGVVITFVESTEIVRTRVALRKANELLRLAVVVRDAFDAITVQDMDGRILAWNPGAMRMYGWTEAEALQMNVRDRIPPGVPAQTSDSTTQRLAKDGSVVSISLTTTELTNAAGHIYAIATTERSQPLATNEARHG